MDTFTDLFETLYNFDNFSDFFYAFKQYVVINKQNSGVLTFLGHSIFAHLQLHWMILIHIPTVTITLIFPPSFVRVRLRLVMDSNSSLLLTLRMRSSVMYLVPAWCAAHKIKTIKVHSPQIVTDNKKNHLKIWN